MAENSPYTSVLNFPSDAQYAPTMKPLEVEFPPPQPTPAQPGSKALSIEVGDGSVIIDFNPDRSQQTAPAKFDANLALNMDGIELSTLASTLLQGIEADDQSRREWITQHAKGINLLGFIIEDNASTAGDEGAALEGMTRIRHSLLAEATILFNAQACAELLPAAGPAKIRDDQPSQPPPPPGAHNNSDTQMVEGAGGRDLLADAYAKDFNHYLTTVAKEYYPDTDRMFFHVGYGGQGIKKVYNCPIRRRPVSESVPMADFIVSNALTDLANASRKTHRIRMRHSILRRMQILNVYRDVPLVKPQLPIGNEIERTQGEVLGVRAQSRDPEDAEHELYECYCELVIDKFAPKQFKGKGLPLPYRVTIAKESREILELRRNWRQDDPQAMAKEYFVDYSYLKAFGFYGIGLLHILGNTAKALTTSWREIIDAGQFANFPGFLYAKGAGRQMTNTFRVAPGTGVGLDIGLQRIQDAVMPLPYKEAGPAFTAFIQHVEEVGQRLSGAGTIQVSEGKEEAPVGTTLALIEQATRVISAALRRMHFAQQLELNLIRDRFREDPEAFWRFGCKSRFPWQRDQFLQALNDCDLVPVSDPNNPTTLHRSAKAMVIQQAAMAAPGLFDLQKVWGRIGRQVNIENPEDLLAPPPPPGSQPPDPRLQGRLAEIEWKKQDSAMKTMTSAQQHQMDLADRAAERESRERVAQIEQDTERLRLASTLAIHADKADTAREALQMKTVNDMHAANRTAQEAEAARAHERQMADRKEHIEGFNAAREDHQAAQERAQSAELAIADKVHEHMQAAEGRQHEQQQAAVARAHDHDLAAADRAHKEQMAERDRAHKERLARMKPKPKSTNGGGK